MAANCIRLEDCLFGLSTHTNHVHNLHNINCHTHWMSFFLHHAHDVRMLKKRVMPSMQKSEPLHMALQDDHSTASSPSAAGEQLHGLIVDDGILLGQLRLSSSRLGLNYLTSSSFGHSDSGSYLDTQYGPYNCVIPKDGCLSIYGCCLLANSTYRLSHVSNSRQYGLEFPIHMVQPPQRFHNDPLSNVYTFFRDYARKMIADGESIEKIPGSADTDEVIELSHPNSTSASELSRWASAVISAYSTSSLARRLGAVHVYMKMMNVSNINSPSPC